MHFCLAGFDTSSWQAPTVVSHSVSPPSEFGSAQWVWTDDDATVIYCVYSLLGKCTVHFVANMAQIQNYFQIINESHKII